MTLLDERPIQPPLAVPDPRRERPSPTHRPRLHQRLSTRRWARLKVMLTVGVFVACTVVAVVIAFRAPTVSPVSPTSAATAATAPIPAPTNGLLDLFGTGAGRGRDNGFGGGGGRRR